MEKECKKVTKVYKRRCEEIEILIFYRVVLQRISRHLSSAEVSYLMGKSLDFMYKIETFRIKTISIQDACTLYYALQLNHIDSTMFLTATLSRQRDDYELHVTKLPDRVNYELYRLDDKQGRQVLEFKLIDVLHDPAENSSSEKIEALRILLHEEIDQGYFSEKKRPYEVHRLCCDKLKQYVCPTSLRIVMDELLQRTDGPRIIRKKSNYGFVYILDPSNKEAEKK